ncbi:BspA family leucine-rich repeat surface protein [Lactiplantibacillus fabifermentans]|nr:BspA family leucine-rich repeat surface protein [Lactiplantibacillus fabifermentans]ETY73676.1 hypothetical protein LFAB_11260 [Lactiplantibacillus fabifermentans T30PCM01]
MNNSKMHYKMYKKGRFWVFAGITAISWQFSSLNIQADTVTTAANSDSAAETSQTTATNATSGQTVTLRTSSSSTENTSTASTADDTTNSATTTESSSATATSAATTESASATKTTNADAGSTSTTAATTTSTASSSDQPTTDSSSATTTSSNSQTNVTATTSASAVTDDTTANHQTADAAVTTTANQNTTSATTTDETGTNTDTLTATTDSQTPAATTPVTTTENATLSDTTQAATVATDLDATVTTTAPTIAATAVTATPTATPVLTPRLARASLLRAATTDPWYVDTTGTELHFSAGTTLTSAATNGVTTQPWSTYANTITTIVFDGAVTAGSSLNYLFANLPKLTSITNANLFDTSAATTMLHMFENDTNLTSLDLNTWQTRNVKNMNNMFANDTSLTTLNIDQWNTSAVTDMSYMFNNASSLTALDLNTWDTGNVTNMAAIFSGASSLTQLAIDGWNTSNVNSMQRMFYDTNALTTLDLNSWDTGKVLDMSNMFSMSLTGKSKLKTLTIDAWNTASVTTMKGLFSLRDSLTSLDLNTWNTSKVTDMTNMFSADSALTSLNIADWDVSNVTSMERMFNKSGLLTLDIHEWTPIKVTSMVETFNGMPNLTVLSIGNWDTSSLTSMGGTFASMTALTSLDVSGWDTSNVTNMGGLFTSDSQLTTLNIGNWDTHNVTNMYNMFAKMTALTTLDLSGDNWDMTNVTNFQNMLLSSKLATGYQLTKLVLGKNVTLGSLAKLGLANYLSTAQLKTYTGNWINASQPTKVYSSDDLLAAYAQPTGTVETYIWQVIPTLNVNTTGATVKLGTTWDATTGFISGTDDYGKALSASDITNDSATAVNYQKPGVYTVTYTYTYQTTGDTTATLTATAPVTVYGILLNETEKRLATTAVWDPASNINTAVDNSGKTVASTDNAITITITNDRDNSVVTALNRPGNYTVTYTLNDYSTTAAITVFFDAAVDAQNSAVKLNGTWDLTQAIKAVKDENGNVITDYSRVSLNTPVDTSKLGPQNIVLTYTDAAGNVATSTAVQVYVYGVTLNETSKTLFTTNTWQPADNVKAAADNTGNSLTGNQVTITMTDANGNTVSALNRPGTYTVAYTVNDYTTTAQITVVSDAKVTGQASHVKLNGTWTLAQAIQALQDETGTTITDYSRVTVDHAVDTSTLGTQTITLTYTDAAGNVTTSDAVPVYVYGITLKEPTKSLYTTEAWQPSSNVQTAYDNAGQPVANEAVTITMTDAQGQPVTALNRPGTYTVNYTVNDYTTSAIVTVYTKAAVTGQDSSVKLNGTWDLAEAIKALVNEAGTTITDYTQVTSDHAVDTSKLGPQTITLTYTDAAGNSVTSLPVQVYVYGVTLNETTKQLTTTNNWSVAGNVNTAFDNTGTALTGNEVTIAMTDSRGQAVTALNQLGTYQITYTVNDYTATAVVTVVSNAAIKTQTATVKVGQTWDYRTGLVSATDENGADLDFSNITVDQAIATAQPGSYTVQYRYTDASGYTVTSTGTVIVYGVTLKETSKKVVTTSGWQAQSNVATAGDNTGQTLTPAQVTIADASGHPVTTLTTPGVYQVNYTVNDFTTTATITVYSDAKVTGQNTAVKLGDTWHYEANLASAQDENGQPLAANQVVVSNGTVDTATVGTYPITLAYTDAAGNTVYSQVVNVFVYGVTLNDTELTKTTTSPWQPSNNVHTAVDNNGQPVAPTDVDIVITNDHGQVVTDLTTPGRYQVSYTVNDYTTTATVNVISKATLVSQGTALKLGSTWQSATGITSATDENGDPLDFSQIRTTTNLDANTLGTYQVSYSYTDAAGNVTTSTAQVFVYGLTLKETTKHLSTTTAWDPSQNVATAVTPTGTTGTAADITMVITNADGQVVTSLGQVGTYDISYTIADYTAHAIVTVTSQAGLSTHDTTVTQGSTWTPDTGFISGTDENGDPLTADQLTVTGKVDTNTPGTYEVTYTYTDTAGNQTSQTTTVTVVANDNGNNSGDNGNTNNNENNSGNNGNTDNNENNSGDNGNTDNNGNSSDDNDDNGDDDNDGFIDDDDHYKVTSSDDEITPTPVDEQSAAPSTSHRKSNKLLTTTQPSKQKANAGTSPNVATAATLVKDATKTTATNQGAKQLPQTDEQTNRASVAGAILLALSSTLLGLGTAFKRRHD